MNTPIDPQAQENRPQINEQRRRLAKAGLAAPVVMGTLLSRPVLGADAPHNCTISGKLSGNTSTHGEEVTCSTLGLSPGYWKKHLTAWDPLLPNAKFNTVFEDAYWWKQINANSYKLAKPNTSGFFADPTMFQILNNGGGMESNKNFPALGRAAIASWLNAYHRPNFPLTQLQVVAIFKAVHNGGSYEVKPGVFWNANCVICYFESLYNRDSDEASYCSSGSCAGL